MSTTDGSGGANPNRVHGNVRNHNRQPGQEEFLQPQMMFQMSERLTLWIDR